MQKISTNGPQPEYIENEKSGPAHAPVFKITCNFKNLTTVGEDRTKKTAKNLAAKLMLEKICSETKDEDKNNDVENIFSNYFKDNDELSMNSYVNNLTTDYNNKLEASTAKAKELFPTLTNRFFKSFQKKNTDDHLDDIEKLQSIYNSKNIKNFGKRLNDIIQSCTRILYNSEYDGKHDEPLTLLTNLFNDLNIVFVVEHDNYQSINNCIIIVKTDPCTIQVGFGNTKIQAEISAILHVTHAILILMNKAT